MGSRGVFPIGLPGHSSGSGGLEGTYLPALIILTLYNCLIKKLVVQSYKKYVTHNNRVTQIIRNWFGYLDAQIYEHVFNSDI